MTARGRSEDVLVWLGDLEDWSEHPEWQLRAAKIIAGIDPKLALLALARILRHTSPEDPTHKTADALLLRICRRQGKTALSSGADRRRRNRQLRHAQADDFRKNEGSHLWSPCL